MRRRITQLILAALLVLWGLTLLPGAVVTEAKSEFVNVVGKDVGVDIHQFMGPIKRRYGSYKWYHVDHDGDSLYVFITVRPYFFGSNSIRYETSSSHKSLEDFPGMSKRRL